MAHKNLSLISGGVRSGKSSFAEQLATEAALKIKGGKLHYIACGSRTDEEMVARINRHKADRAKNSIPWETWECPHQLSKVAHNFTKRDVVLVDCLTTLLANEMFNLQEQVKVQSQSQEFFSSIRMVILSAFQHLSLQAGVVIIVSNEVLHEPIKSDPFSFVYSRLLGQLHQDLVKLADSFYLIENGIPNKLKGD